VEGPYLNLTWSRNDVIRLLVIFEIVVVVVSAGDDIEVET
jgi:hypothetical protein